MSIDVAPFLRENEGNQTHSASEVQPAHSVSQPDPSTQRTCCSLPTAGHSTPATRNAPRRSTPRWPVLPLSSRPVHTLSLSPAWQRSPPHCGALSPVPCPAGSAHRAGSEGRLRVLAGLSPTLVEARLSLCTHFSESTGRLAASRGQSPQRPPVEAPGSGPGGRRVGKGGMKQGLREGGRWRICCPVLRRLPCPQGTLRPGLPTGRSNHRGVLRVHLPVFQEETNQLLVCDEPAFLWRDTEGCSCSFPCCSSYDLWACTIQAPRFGPSPGAHSESSLGSSLCLRSWGEESGSFLSF